MCRSLCSSGLSGAPSFLDSKLNTGNRFLNVWNCVGLLLLPSVYWSLDLLIHIIGEILSRWQLFLLLWVGLPVIVILASITCWRRWRRQLSGCINPGFTTLLGIYISGPTYRIVSTWILSVIGNTSVVIAVSDKISEWALFTLIFPVSTMLFTIYEDGTPLSPFLTCLGVLFVSREHRQWGRIRFMWRR